MTEHEAALGCDTGGRSWGVEEDVEVNNGHPFDDVVDIDIELGCVANSFGDWCNTCLSSSSLMSSGIIVFERKSSADSVKVTVSESCGRLSSEP